MTTAEPNLTEVNTERAELTHGLSHDLIYASVQREVAKLPLGKTATMIDIGCGRGYLRAALSPYVQRYIGVDLVKHVDFPDDQQLVVHDLDRPGIPLPDACAELVIACEVTPCLENPRQLLRECVRLCKPGGWVIVHNPNLRSWFSLISLVFTGEHRLYREQSAAYMISPMLEVDMVRMAKASGLTEPKMFYTLQGRIPVIHRYFPQWFARLFPRGCSDHLGMIAHKPATAR